ncbi:EF-hand domain-containing protein, partial [Roseomonas sp. DSM 102946]|nr:EF-hand domain-containing protein [Roseomonas sp. DSM 102946]
YVTSQRAAGGRRADRPVPPAMEARAEALFRAADANGDGRVTLAELQPVAQAFFRMADRNGDGTLTPDELRPAGHGASRGAGQGAAPAR